MGREALKKFAAWGDTALGLVLAAGLGALFLLPTSRALGRDLYLQVAMVGLIALLRDRWLKWFGAACYLSLFLVVPRWPGADVTIMGVVLTLAFMDRWLWRWHEKAVAGIYAGALIVAAVMALYPVFVLGRPLYFWPLDNTIFAGGMWGIMAGLVFPWSKAASAVLAAAALGTRSTTAALCLLASLTPAALAGVKTRGRLLLAQAAAALSVLAFAFFVDPYHRFAAKVVMLVDTLELARQRFLGYGWGSFRALAPGLEGDVLDGRVWGQAHCEPAQLLFEAGWPAFLVVVAFILRHCARRPQPTPEGRAAHGAMSAYILFSLVAFPFHYAGAAALFPLVYRFYRRANLA